MALGCPSRDPAKDSIGLYSYVNARPNIFSDPSGMICEDGEIHTIEVNTLTCVPLVMFLMQVDFWTAVRFCFGTGNPQPGNPQPGNPPPLPGNPLPGNPPPGNPPPGGPGPDFNTCEENCASLGFNENNCKSLCGTLRLAGGFDKLWDRCGKIRVSTQQAACRALYLVFCPGK